MKVADIFSSHAVLQRDKEVVIWGNGQLGQKVCASLIDKAHNASEVLVSKSQNGDKWEIILKKQPAGGPFDLVIESDDEKIELEDILFGDVWIAGGQSNMEYRLKDDIEADSVLPVDRYENIHYFDVPRINNYNDYQKVEWESIEPEQFGELTAVGYYFAKELYETDKDVPIGIVNCNWGGTSVSAWMDESYLSEGSGKIYLEEFENFIKEKPEETLPQQVVEYEKEIEDWNNKWKEGEQKGLKDKELEDYAGPYPWKHPSADYNEFRPCRLYHTMFQTFIPLTVKGAIYYQGETDTYHREMYAELMNQMIKCWRKDVRDEEMPYLFVQLTSFCGWADGPDWAELRDQQLTAWQTIKNTGMIVSTDFGDEWDIHPKQKKPLGFRLAKMARALVYGDDIVYSGPIAKEIDINDNYAIIKFDHVGSGLVLMSDESFEIAGEDGVFYKATPMVFEDTICLSADEVKKPTQARYAWSNVVKVSLYNEEGFPASGFCLKK